MRIADLLPGEWYFVVTCPSCRTRQALCTDPSRGKTNYRLTYAHTCDVCEVATVYESKDIVTYQHGVERLKG